MLLEALTKEGAALFPALARFNNFYLAGGTALALQIGHRVSVDFDLFSSDQITKRQLDQVKRVFAGREIVVSINNPEELTVFVDGVKTTFLHYPFPVLGGLIDVGGVKSLNVLELAATKAYTVGRRGSFKDHLDLYFVIKLGHISLEDIIDLANKKYSGEFNSRLFLEQLIYLDDIELTPIVYLSADQPDKQQLKDFFIGKIKLITV